MLDDFREWLSDNLRYILLGLAIILIVVIGFCVVKLIMSSSGSDSKKENQVSTESVQSADMTETEVSTENSGTAQAGASTVQGAAEGTSSLALNDTAILTLVKKYYAAVAAKDIVTLESIVSPWDDEVKENVLRNDGVIESYNNISTYSKKGPVDNSYVVFVYFEGKVVNIETLVPSLSMLYLTTDTSGNLVVSDRNSSQEVADYIESVRSDADVQALVTDVDAQCEKAMNSDPALKAFMDSAGGDDTQGDGQDSGTVTAVTGEMVVTADAINIRQEPNTSSAIMGMVVAGTTVTVTETAEDGWCKISYNSSAGVIEGYVKQEYLAAPGSTGDGTV